MGETLDDKLFFCSSNNAEKAQNRCTYKTKKKYNISIHTKSHSGIRQYPCDDCGYSSIKIVQLKNHARTKHKGFKIHCEVDGCEFVGTSIGSLKRHILSKHDFLKIPCDECEYTQVERIFLKDTKLWNT